VSLILPSSWDVHERAYSPFDSIPRRAFFSYGLIIFPIHSSRNLSGVNLRPLALWDDLGINHLSQGHGIGMALAIAVPLQLSPASGVLSSDKGTGFTFWATHW